MPESFAGITVPAGNPEGVRAAGSRIHGLGGSLGGIADQLRAMPSGMSAWQGPASVSYAGSCMTVGGMAGVGVDALGTAAQLTRTYADDLETAQLQTRAAIVSARDATRRIRAAQAAISAARTAQADATQRAISAQNELTLTAAAGAPSAAAQTALTTAQADGVTAADAEVRAQGQLTQAEHDLQAATRRGQAAERNLHDAARAIANAFGALAGSAPVPVPVMAPASGEHGGDHAPSWLPYFVWGERGVDAGLITLEKGGDYMSEVSKISVAPYVRAGGYVRGYFRTAGDGSTTWVDGYWRSGGQVAGYLRDTPTAARWATVSEAVGRASVVLAFAAPAFEQWSEDSGNSQLSTTDRVGRTAGASAYVGASALAGGVVGAEAGAAIGSVVPVLGTAAGGVVGAIVGGVAGSGAAGYVASQTKDLAVHIGQDTANGVVDGAKWVGNTASGAWNDTSGVRHEIGSVLDSINPF